MKKQLFSLLALLLMAAGGAMAQNENTASVTQLTKNADGNWVLDAMPGFDGVLEVTFFERFKLDSIPLTWTITVNGGDSTSAVTRYSAEEGDTTMGWLMVMEGADVRLVPPVPVKPTVKSVTLEEVPAVEPADDLDNTTTAWADGSRLQTPAGGLTYGDAVTVSGNVTLTLTEGTTLTLNKGISLAEGATLTVQGTGTMAVNGTDNSTASTVAGSGTLVLTSGTLTAKGGNGQSLTIDWESANYDDNRGASGGVAINGNVTVSGGTVTATGGNGGNLNTSALSGGTFDNRGGNGGAAISGSVTVNGGTWTATNGSNGTFTGNGDDSGCSAGTGGAAVAGTVTDNR